VKTIGTSAFSDCRNLREVALQSGLGRIKERAFRNCTGLSKISFPSSVMEVGCYAFDNCVGLSKAKVNEIVRRFGPRPTADESEEFEPFDDAETDAYAREEAEYQTALEMQEFEAVDLWEETTPRHIVERAENEGHFPY
jgi:hypothetical protein